MAGKKSTKTKNTAEEQASSTEQDNSQALVSGEVSLANDLESQMMAAMQLEGLFQGGQTQQLGMGNAPTVMTREQIESNVQNGPEIEGDENDLETLFEDLSSTVQEFQSQVDKRLEKTAKELSTQLEVVRALSEQQHKALHADLNSIDKHLETLLERQQLTAGLVEKIGQFTLVIAQKVGAIAPPAGQQAQAAAPTQQQQAAAPTQQQAAPQGTLAAAAHTPPAAAAPQQTAAPTAQAQDHGVPDGVHKPILTAVPSAERPPVTAEEFCARILKFLATYNVHLKPEQIVAFLRTQGCINAEGLVYRAS